MTYLGVTEGQGLDPYEYASGFVRAYCNRRFDYVANDTVFIDPRPDRTAQLPEGPVISISTVQAYMPGPPTGQWAWQTLQYPQQYDWAERGLIWDTSHLYPPINPVLPNWMEWPWPTWPWLPGKLQVTYTHGYQTIPAEITAIVYRIAAQVAANPLFMQSKKTGEDSVVFGSFPGGITLRDTDKAILDRYVIQDVS